ncbi:Vesicle-mediated ER to Golgi transport protein [Chytridiales sp. JEL 0842]|nr:Vesicle-mediated ER to Golgi transport protein [Chytridiales sp. JEL 0842]
MLVFVAFLGHHLNDIDHHNRLFEPSQPNPLSPSPHSNIRHLTVSFLFSALRGDKGQVQKADETIDKLTDRVLNSTLIEDRRGAVLGLKGLAREYKLDVGTKGMPVLINVLKNDRMDVEIIKAALETLNILCTADAEGGKEHHAGKTPTSPTEPEDSRDLGVMLTEIYIKVASNVTILLDILEEYEFYVRFNTIQFLSTLLENMGSRLQECILTSPIGISRLMDLLDDKREIIRNEGLLLLISLTQNNAEIQKIIAFENAFDRLIGIILDEGAAEGGIIVQDCLNLTLNLLRYNVSNQNLFRESSCIQRIPSLLISHAAYEDDNGPVPVPLTHEANQWVEQKVVNATLILELVRILVVPNSPNTKTNQTVMNQAHVLPPIIDIALSERVPKRVKAQALFAIGDILKGCIINQDLFSKFVVPPEPISIHGITRLQGYPKPALLALIKIALKSEEEFRVRAAATYAFESLLANNPDNQIALAATLTPPPPDNPNEEQQEQPQSPGSLLISTVLKWEEARRDPYQIWFATVMLSHIVNGNAKCQELALNVRIDDEGDEPISLLHKVMFALLFAHKDNADVRIIVGMMTFIATWMDGSVKAVKEFLTEGSNLQFVVNQSSGVDTLIQGIAAFLLAICHEYNDDSEPAFTQASLQTLIVSRIGADIFVSRLERLKESKYFQKASPYLISNELNNSKGLPDVYFDTAFVELLKNTSDSMVKGVINPKAKASAKSAVDEAHKAMIDSYKKTAARQEKELEAYKQKIAEMERAHTEQMTAMTEQLAAMSHQLSLQHAAPQANGNEAMRIQELERQLYDQNEMYNTLVKEQEDLLVCLAEGDLQIRQLKDRLRALGQEVESDEEEEDED